MNWLRVMMMIEVSPFERWCAEKYQESRAISLALLPMAERMDALREVEANTAARRKAFCQQRLAAEPIGAWHFDTEARD